MYVIEQKLIEETKKININIGIDYILDCLNDRYRWPINYHDGQPSVEVILENGNKSDVLFSATDNYLITDLVHGYYDKGYTILLSRVQKLNKDINNLAKIVNSFCGREVNINAYFGKGTKSISFPPHTHEYAVLVKNVVGVSKWTIDDKNYILRNQDVLYFDAFKDHVVTEITEPKFTLTCNLVR